MPKRSRQSCASIANGKAAGGRSKKLIMDFATNFVENEFDIYDEDLGPSQPIVFETEKVDLLELKWTNTAGTDLRKCYTGQSERTKYRKAANKKLLLQQAETSDVAMFEKYFKLQSGTLNKVEEVEKLEFVCGFEEKRLDFVLEKLKECTNFARNKRISRASCSGDFTLFDLNRLRCVSSFFNNIKEGQKKMEAASNASKALLNGRDYESRCIRYWARHYFETLCLPVFSQGCHQKTVSLISDEDIREKCLNHLRLCKEVTVDVLKSFVDDQLIPTLVDSSKATVSPRTIRNWLHELGYSKLKEK